jgi:hypothetical protein
MATWADVSRIALAPHFNGYPAVLVRLGLIDAARPQG